MQFYEEYIQLHENVNNYNAITKYTAVFQGFIDDIYKSCLETLKAVNAARIGCKDDLEKWNYCLKQKSDGEIEIGVNLNEI